MKLTVVIAAMTALGSFMPAAAQEQALGRLFFTPGQRAQLDTARTQRARTALEGSDEQATAPASQTIRYGGMVRRGDGKSTVWINNSAVHDNQLASGVIVGRVRADGAVSLQIPQAGGSVVLKPGQSLEIVSGIVEEGFHRKPEPIPAADERTAAKRPASNPAASQRELAEEKRKLMLRAPQEAAAKAGSAPVDPGPTQRPSH